MLRIEDSGVHCTKCQKWRGVYAHVRTDEGVAKVGPYCLNCFAAEVPGFIQPLASAKRQAPTRRMKRLSKRQDQQIAEGIGARQQKASGATAANKGDIRKQGQLRIETKYTFARSYRLSYDDLQKIRSECTGLEQPVFIVDFKDKGSGRTYDRWAMVPHKEWERLFNASSDDQ